MQVASDRIDLMRRALELARAALDQPEHGRQVWLVDRCRDDVALREEALALLQRDGAPARLLDQAYVTLAAPHGQDDLLPGCQIGRFRIVGRLGSGGMGTVYRGEPVSGVARHPVALKLVKRGMDSEEILARFMREREILARLDHPNIARLLDGGISEEGRAWFAMELVDGDTLPAYCDTRRLDLDARIGLFLAACEAVDYAHRNLIVHRDLKPANVLVTHEGVLKLLDFGIAKLLDAGDDSATRDAAPFMTPGYAAPEQYSRGPVTTQTDVFQLGVLLHELLGGVRPNVRDTQGDSLDCGHVDALLRARRAGDPAAIELIAKSRGTHPAALLRSLRGDLDRIIRRAMHPIVDRRYASVGALSDDLRRFRRGVPISATADTLAYRLRMLVRRHRVAASAALVATLSLGIGVAVALHSAYERSLAERATASTLAVLEDVFLGADPYKAKGGDTRATDLLAHARKRIEADFANQPAIAARLLQEIGSVYVSLDDRAAAEPVLREAVQVGARAGASALVPTESARARLAHFALVVDGDKSHLHDLDTAIERLRDAGPDARDALAQALDFKADYLFNTGAYAAIPAISAQAVELHRLANGAVSVDYATALANQASLLRAVGRERESLDPAQTAYRIIATLGDEAAPNSQLYVAQQYAGALGANGRPIEAEPILRTALARAQSTLGADDNLTIGIAWELASTQSTIGQFAAAVEGLRALLARPGIKSANIAAINNALGEAELEQGHAAAAEIAFATAVPLVCADGEKAPPCVVLRLNRAQALLALARGDEARALLPALDADIGSTGSRSRQRWVLLDARQKLAGGDADGALSVLTPLLAAARASVVPSLDDANVLAQAAAIEERRGDRATALRDYRAAERNMAAKWTGVPPALGDVRAHIEALEKSPSN